MKLRKSIGAVFICVFLVGAYLALYSTTIPSQDHPRSLRGQLDLTHWDFAERGRVALDGEWEFYENELLSPEDFRQGTRPEAVYLSVPSTWKGKRDGQGMSRKGYGTYRLVLRMTPSEEIYGLKVNSIRMGHRLYINGELLEERGQPSIDRDDNKPGNTPYTTFFDPDGSKVEIIIQVTNFDFVTGGIVSSPQFGLSGDMTKLSAIQIGTDVAIVLILLILGAYHIGVYLIGRQERVYLLSGLYMIVLGLQTSVYGEKITQRVWPELPFDVAYKAIEFGQFIGSLLFILLLGTIERRLMKRRTMLLALTPFVLYLMAVLALPYRYPISIKYYLVIYNVAFLLYVAARMLLFYKRSPAGTPERQERLIFLFGLLSLLVYLTDVSLYAENAVPDDLIGKCGMIAFIVLMNLQIAIRFSNELAKSEQLTRQLQLSNELKDEFLVNTSHELKTPLNGILNMISYLLEEGEGSLTEKQKKNLWLVKDTSSKLSMLIQDLIDVTRLKHDELRLHPSAVDLRVAAQIVIDMLQFELAGKQVQLDNRIESDVWVVADENRLRQILYNVVHNAIKHTDSGSIHIGAVAESMRIKVIVEDTGTGIAPQKRTTLFHEYEPLMESPQRDGYEGMGVGLYISRKLVERMGGEIFVEWTEVGEGTRMAFTLPRMDILPSYYEAAAASEGARRVALEEGPLDSVAEHEHTILIVDDEASNIHMLLTILRQKYNVLTAFSAKEAIAKLQEAGGVDLALLDLMMPQTSGIELCRMLRMNHSILDLPILIATVKDTPQDIALGFRAGANDYVTKPFDGETLLARIQTLIAMKTSIQDAMLSEQAFYQAQIKPHFLYNALSSIIGFCYTDGEKAASLLSVLSQYIRHILETDRQKPLVPLRRELEVIEAYAEIEKARFGDRFDFICEIEEGLMDFEVPSLSIQPFVENAIRHGLFEKDGTGSVWLMARNEENYVVVTIKDDGVGIPYDRLQRITKGEKSESRAGVGIGIANIRKRLDGIPGAALTLHSERGAGTEVTIYLPYDS